MTRRAWMAGAAHLVLWPKSRALAEKERDMVLWSPGSSQYESARKIFNTDVSLRPGLIADCRSNDGVVAAIQTARQANVPVTVKCGGHSFVGHSLNDDGMVVDLGKMNRISQVSETGSVTIQPGQKLQAVYETLLPQGHLLPAGSCAGVGVGGLTLGGGYGLFAREHGLTCDHLTGVTMVSGKGELIDSDDDPDLLWACRGGGNSNFGAIISMRFRTQPAPPLLSAQRFTHSPSSVEASVAAAKSWFEMADGLPGPIFSAFVMNGKRITVLLTSTHGPTGPAFSAAATRLKQAGFLSKGATRKPTVEAIKTYYGRTDPLPFHNFSGGYYRGFSDVAGPLEAITAEVRSHSGLIYQINTLGGQITAGPESAYPHRAWPYLGEVQAYWNHGDDRHRGELIAAASKVREFLTAGGITRHYRNYPSLDFQNWEQSYFAETYARLQELKKRYDPENLFRGRQSVRLP